MRGDPGIPAAEVGVQARPQAEFDAEGLELPDSPLEAANFLYARGMTDGLPVVPPTIERVAEVLTAAGVEPDLFLGRLPPRLGAVTARALAINCVMAGCRPEHFAVVVALAQALLDERFNLLGVQTTTHPCTCVVLVNGPIRHQLKMNLAGNALGDSNQTSAVIGRALRFVLRNIGGAIPGATDATTQGTPARAGFVFAEGEEVSPFAPFHTTRGLAAHDSAVTIFAGEGPHNVNDHASTTGEGFVRVLAASMAGLGCNDVGRTLAHPVVVLGPEHAALLDRDGFSRATIQQFLFEHARIAFERIPPQMRAWLEMRDDVDKRSWSERGVPIAQAPEHFSIVVAGGAGKHSSFIPTFGYSVPITQAIRSRHLITCDC